MRGYQLTFFTQHDQKKNAQSLGHWLIELARELGIRGATLIPAGEGFGPDRRLHSAHFLELADQPQEIIMAVTEEECDMLFSRLSAENISVFYIKTPIEFGVLGGQ